MCLYFTPLPLLLVQSTVYCRNEGSLMHCTILSMFTCMLSLNWFAFISVDWTAYKESEHNGPHLCLYGSVYSIIYISIFINQKFIAVQTKHCRLPCCTLNRFAPLLICLYNSNEPKFRKTGAHFKSSWEHCM